MGNVAEDVEPLAWAKTTWTVTMSVDNVGGVSGEPPVVGVVGVVVVLRCCCCCWLKEATRDATLPVFNRNADSSTTEIKAPIA